MSGSIHPSRRGIWARRVPDVARHLADLAVNRYEGADTRAHREEIFRGAVRLVGPVVESVLAELNALYLGGAGQIDFAWVAGTEGLEAAWDLGWPQQRAATRRASLGGPPEVGPIRVSAIFPPGWTHGHLRGEHVGHWPLQVLDESDAARQYEVIWAIAEAELHEWIFATEHPWEHLDPLDAGGAATFGGGGYLKRQLRIGMTVRGIFIRGTDPVEVLAAADASGLDFVIVDREHAPSVTDHELAALSEIGFLRGLAVLVRIAAPLPHLAATVLDIGASGVVIPQCRSSQQVGAVLAACYLPPLGTRGFSPRTRAGLRAAELNPQGSLADRVATLNGSTAVIVQVETPEMLADLPTIAPDARVDAYLLGAHDLAAASGAPDADVRAAALERMASVLRAHGRPWGDVVQRTAEATPAERDTTFRILGAEGALTASAIAELAREEVE